MVKQINGSYVVKYQPKNSTNLVEIDFTPPFKRIDLLSELEKVTETKFPSDLSTEETRVFFDELCKKLDVDCSNPRSTSRLIDKLVGKYIEPHCVNPTYIMNHPLIMSPLAKPHRENSQITERFELFVNCFEICNAYTELNDPRIQRKNFELQAKAKEKGDDEAQPIDENFIEALEFGLPPCGGFGLGIERMTMLLSNRDNIDDIILFPTLKPE
jgi:lysyl-tRNA synthetase class 2